jgi:hypothetical protein
MTTFKEIMYYLTDTGFIIDIEKNELRSADGKVYFGGKGVGFSKALPLSSLSSKEIKEIISKYFLELAQKFGMADNNKRAHFFAMSIKNYSDRIRDSRRGLDLMVNTSNKEFADQFKAELNEYNRVCRVTITSLFKIIKDNDQ